MTAYYKANRLMVKAEAEATTKASDKFFELPLEDRSIVLKVTEALHRKRFGVKKKMGGGGAVIALTQAAISHDIILTGVLAFWEVLSHGAYI